MDNLLNCTSFLLMCKKSTHQIKLPTDRFSDFRFLGDLDPEIFNNFTFVWSGKFHIIL